MTFTAGKDDKLFSAAGADEDADERDEREDDSDADLTAADCGTGKDTKLAAGVKGSKPQSRMRHLCSAPFGNRWNISPGRGKLRIPPIPLAAS